MAKNEKMASYIKGIFESGTDKQIAELTISVVGRVPKVAQTDQALMTIIFMANIARVFEFSGQKELFDYVYGVLYRFEYSDELINKGKFDEALSYAPFLQIIYQLLDSWGLDPIFLADFVEYMEKRIDNIKHYMNYR